MCCSLSSFGCGLLTFLLFAMAAPGRKANGNYTYGDKLSQIDCFWYQVQTATKVWIDHCTMSKGPDGLLDVTVGSTGVTISNCRFHDHDKVILLGKTINTLNIKICMSPLHLTGMIQDVPKECQGVDLGFSKSLTTTTANGEYTLLVVVLTLLFSAKATDK
ncbi:pectate lyase 1-like protein [Tanacetum coccineum]